MVSKLHYVFEMIKFPNVVRASYHSRKYLGVAGNGGSDSEVQVAVSRPVRLNVLDTCIDQKKKECTISLYIAVYYGQLHAEGKKRAIQHVLRVC